MTKKLLAFVLLLLALGAGLYYLGFGKEELSYEKAANRELTEISMEGEVLYSGPNRVIIRTGMVQKSDQGNVFVPYDKTLSFTDTVRFVTNGEESVVGSASIASYVKVGNRAIFYGSGVINSISKEEIFTVSRVELLSSANTAQ